MRLEFFKKMVAIACCLLVLSGCQKLLDNDLIRAAEAGNVAEVHRLLSKGANANSKDGNGYPALYFAAYKGRLEVVILLLDKGADVNAKGNGGYTPLHGAAMGGYRDIAELLIDRGADVNAKSIHGLTPLQEARNNEVAELLAGKGGIRP